MLGKIFARQDARVYLGMQGFYPSIEHLGKAGVISNLGNGKARILQQFGGTAGGQEGYPKLMQLPRKFDNAGLVGNTDQGLFNGHLELLLETGRRAAFAAGHSGNLTASQLRS